MISVLFKTSDEQTICEPPKLLRPNGGFEFVCRNNSPFKLLGHAKPIGYCSPPHEPSSSEVNDLQIVPKNPYSLPGYTDSA